MKIISSGRIKRNHSWVSAFQRLFDAGSVVFLLPMLCALFEVSLTKPYQIVMIIAGTFVWISMGVVNAYRPWRGSSTWQELRIIAMGWLMVVIGLLFMGWITRSGDVFSHLVMTSWFMLSPILLCMAHVVLRLVLRYFRARGYNTRKVIIVGAGDLGQQLAERIQESGWMGMTLLGFFDDDPDKQILEMHGYQVLGKTEDVYAYVWEHNIDQVYLALPMRSEKRMREVFDVLQDTTASLFLVPDLFIFELMGAREQDVGGLPTFALCEFPLTGAFGLLKRLEDVILAAIIFFLISPLLFMISIAVKLTSAGPILFKQVRYGLHGEKIKVYKFRSMTTCDNDETMIKQATKGDTRITPLGAFLRRTSLDELPQFFNVLQGRMSIVGPRPHAVAHNEQYRKLIKGYMWRHKMKPGITGWAQINGWRGETDTLDKMEKRVEFDLEYIRRWSISFDLKIIFLTIHKGFIDENAY
ncbi:MAG: undecaprenyl-phosphate glucose phosphotransferase [Mariprofundaceae bacterium]|nr:undecaprenyl-phosphate glucose phosphotransferase [Mariprofundaceae bacterium]